KDTEKKIIGYCQEKLIKWQCPRNIEFRQELPTTLVGKIAFKVLQDQEIEKLRAKGEYTGEN
ncbi:MAG: hypothetical protein KAR45_06615, partial [Desulfobacteraceae bacterium]|nr:hypothetical protein [Desulfobacteraceae bacterium]